MASYAPPTAHRSMLSLQYQSIALETRSFVPAALAVLAASMLEVLRLRSSAVCTFSGGPHCDVEQGAS